MRAIVNVGPARLVLQHDVPLPQPGPRQVRIKTAACGVCATDLEMIAGWERTGFPAIPGHEWSGVVDSVGPGVDPDLVGRPCVAENVLRGGGEVGFEHPGGYGEYLITDAANVHLLRADFPLAHAALIEPLAVCVRARDRLGLRDRRAALVMGDGPIGLIMVMLLRHAGAESVALVGGRAKRLELGLELGAESTLNYHEAAGELPAFINRRLGGPWPNVIEASGSGGAMNACLDLAAPGGKVLLLGDYGKSRAGFAWNHLLHRELELIGSNAGAGAWPEAVRLAQNGHVALHRLITHRLPVAQYAEAIDLARTSPEAVKVILEWERT